MRLITRAILASAWLALPAAAGAQTTWISPFAGTTSGGDATHASLVVGVSGGRMLTKWIGVEGEAADAPEFFEQNGFLVSRRVTTVAGTAIIPLLGSHRDRLMPYAAGGFGLLRPHYAEAGELAGVKTNKLAVNVGGGVMALNGRSVGIRADVRYFRGLNDDSSVASVNPFGIDFSTVRYWRVSGGLVVRF